MFLYWQCLQTEAARQKWQNEWEIENKCVRKGNKVHNINGYIRNRSTACKQVPRPDPLLTYLVAHFRQPVPPHQQRHLCKVTSSSDSETKIDSHCVVHTAVATCPAVSSPLPVATVLNGPSVLPRIPCLLSVWSCSGCNLA